MRKIAILLTAIFVAATINVSASENKDITTDSKDNITLTGVISTFSDNVPCAIVENSGTVGQKNVIINVISQNGTIKCYSESGMSEFNLISYDNNFDILNVDKLENASKVQSGGDYDIISSFETQTINATEYLGYELNKIEIINYKDGVVEDIFFVVDENVDAVLSPQTISVDGEACKCAPYNIMGNNYIKLRDLAEVIKSSNLRFNVWYDEGKNTVCVKRGSEYFSAIEQTEDSLPQSVRAMPNSMEVLVDNQPLKIEGYNIGGYTYFKLRDLSQIIGFTLEYDEASNNVDIATK